MKDRITDGPRHPDEDADYIIDMVTPFPKAVECPRCKEISLTLKRIECHEGRNIESWECVNCGNEETFV